MPPPSLHQTTFAYPIEVFISALFFSHFYYHLRLNLSGESSASGSPHRSLLDEKADTPAVNPDDLRNTGLAIDLLLLDELPPPANLTLDSDNGKKPLRRKNGDFIPLLRSNPNEYDRFNIKSLRPNLSSELILCESSSHGVISGTAELNIGTGDRESIRGSTLILCNIVSSSRLGRILAAIIGVKNGGESAHRTPARQRGQLA
ncbi:hypothetical protein Lal_00019803 [Lupinus albus]|nr:hypothetical protein Lal_00019803 [Lupinus albus]